jgi:hypothetical protein
MRCSQVTPAVLFFDSPYLANVDIINPFPLAFHGNGEASLLTIPRSWPRTIAAILRIAYVEIISNWWH